MHSEMNPQESLPPTDEDFFGVEEQTSTNDNTERVLTSFRELMKAKAEKAETEAVLEGLTSKISKLETATLPELLKEMGTEIWRDPDSGITIELDVAVNASLPKDQDKRNEMLDNLRPLGIEQIMAEEFNVTFSPNDSRAAALRELLGLAAPPMTEDEKPGSRLTNEQVAMIHDLRNSLGLNDLPAEEKLGVHHSRLKSWLKELINKGRGVEVSAAGIWHGKYAKVVLPKGKK